MTTLKDIANYIDTQRIKGNSQSNPDGKTANDVAKELSNAQGTTTLANLCGGALRLIGIGPVGILSLMNREEGGKTMAISVNLPEG